MDNIANIKFQNQHISKGLETDGVEFIPGMVSIIMPAFNCEKFIECAINSVVNQTYRNWELFIIDDGSTDETLRIANDYSKKDRRIKVIKCEGNSGASRARNIGLTSALGEYIAFLDSDDSWYASKLEKQIYFMKSHKADFTCTAYELIDEEGSSLGCTRIPPKKANYNHLVFLGSNIGNLTAMYSRAHLGNVTVPEIKKRNDFALWLNLLKSKCHYVYGIKESLASYRLRPNSLSTKNWDLVRCQWDLYRNIERLEIWKSLIAMTIWIISKSMRNCREKITQRIESKLSK